MLHKNHFPRLAHIGLILAVALSFAVPASAAWKEKVLYSFQGGTNDGSYPYGSVIFDKQGNLYGVLQDFGGDSCAPLGGECGAVYRLSPPAQKGGSWTETLLYEFQGKGANDGESPNSGLIMDKLGNLYGLTAYGGTGNCLLLGLAAGCGTVYEISPPKQKGGAWTETILYSFPSATQGYVPIGDLVFDSAGNLYGSTLFGGTKGTTCDPDYGGQCGVVFEISPPKKKGGAWTQKVLHNFAGIASGKQNGDGAEPNGGLVLDKQGEIYGTSYYGGYNCPHNSNQGCGTVFKLVPPTKQAGAWTQKALHIFKDAPDGGGPAAGVVFDRKGNLYGTTIGGGGGNPPSGTAFELILGANGSWTERIRHSFQEGNDGGQPRSSPIFDSTGNLYGTALGGQSNRGVVFRLTPTKHGNAWALRVLYNLGGSPDAAYPEAALVIDASGNLYSTTAGGGTGSCGYGGCGTVFEVMP
jgi:uncharacterized repeat protein (TIGR03803 family)